MKNFMLFLHEAADSNSQLSPEDMGALVKAHMEWSDKLASSGHLIAGDGIHLSGVKLVGKEGQMNEGPVIHAGTIIGGYYIIKAQDLTQAVELAKSCPCHLWGGTTEVRQIMSEEDYGG